MQRNSLCLVWTIAAIIMMSCNLPNFQGNIRLFDPTPSNTLVPTVIVTTTEAPLLSTPTETFFVSETNTPTPLPTIVSSPTPSITLVTETPTRTPIPYPCEILSISPPSGIGFDPRWDFDAVWEIKNTGSNSWDDDQVDYAYAFGTEMHKYKSEYKLMKDVPPGGTVTIRVDLLAPAEGGRYSTTWIIKDRNTTLCVMTVTIRVIP